MDKTKIKNLVLRFEGLLSLGYRICHPSCVKGRKGNTVSLGCVFAAGCKVEFYGKNNVIRVAPGLTRLKNCHFFINGSGCRVEIGSRSNLQNVDFYVENDGSCIIIGKHVTINRDTHLAAIEGCSIVVGDDCLFSSGIEFRTGDSHSILDSETKERINPSKDITIGKHVWIGEGATVLKGTTVGDGSVVGTKSVLTGKRFPASAVIGGTPAKVLKEGIAWTPERV